MTEITKKTVLVVDDEKDVRDYLSTALLDNGFLVKTASDGFEALGVLENCIPDLISLDLVMPKHSGMKFYFDIQKDKKFSNIPVLIVTGHAKDDLGRADFNTLTMQGPGVYLEKPVKPSTYVSTICKMLDIDEPESLIGANKELLKNEIEKGLADADPEALKEALKALKKK